MVHRLLSASICADSIFPEMLKGDLVTKIANNLNYRCAAKSVCSEIHLFKKITKYILVTVRINSNKKGYCSS